MTFQKSQLAVAVAMAISMSSSALAAADINSNAGIITLEGTGSVSVGGGESKAISEIPTVSDGDENYIETSSLFEPNLASKVNSDTTNYPYSDGALYYSKDYSLLNITNANLSRMDLDLRNANSDETAEPTEEFLTVGSESTFVFDGVTSQATIIETNGAHIEHNGTAAAIAISNSNLTGVDFGELEEGDEPVVPIWNGAKELLTNNGGEIVSMGLGNAIDIAKSTVDGLIINEDWSNSEAPMNGGFITATKGAAISVNGDSTLTGGIHNVSREDAAKIVGGRTAIEFNDSALNGYIVNEHSGDNQPAGSQPIILGNKVAIAFNNSQINGGIVNEGIIVAEGVTWYDDSTGNATDEQFETLLDNKLTDTSLLEANGDAAILLTQGSVFNGDINNSGRIAGLYGIGSYTSGGTNNSFNGNINNSGIIDGRHMAISLNSTQVNGAINNVGTIKADPSSAPEYPSYGIYIGDSVTGSLTINQLAGELNGDTALRMNSVTRTNYTGGQITGNVANHGGTFYVEGNRTIAGDYMQTAGSTLAMDLHQETSLTADNIDLQPGSRVLIDLSKGDLYVQSGTKVELLRANGTLTDTNVDYVVSSDLVTVAEVERNANGNLVLTFDRTSYSAGIQEELNNKPATVSTRKTQQIQQVARVFDKLEQLPETPAVQQLKQMIQRSTSNTEDLAEAVAQYLPDTSGASVAAAMNASSQAGAQVSVRARGLASGDAFTNSGLWIQGLVSNGKQDNRHGEAYDADSRGFVLGADTELSSGLVLGTAYSFVRSESKTASSRTDSDYHMATAYGAQAIGQLLLDGQVYYAWGDNDSSRNIGANANYDSKLYGARVGAGYQFEPAHATRFVPTLSLEAARLSVDGYTETGSPAALTIGEQDFDRLELGLTTELSKDYQLSHAMVTPSLMLGAFHDFESEAQSSTVAFAAAPAETFTVSGRKPEENRYVAGVGVEIMRGDNLTVSAEYNYNWNGDGFDANTGALKFRWDF
ncbi:autotransporter domain-containing protein [Oceanimonas sp. CAM02]|uniref:autotransporter outer membrane beta-barrel domain-containing protein n=1 Tax=Oceanimonas sp. CAM02 TaxID=3080336 RepID=UPI0029362FBD|nr:autotransporter domain-containing protein [Oceanimonas sp. CAM02]MDV2856847.1 autotransporter domain-containing protein [Oceanimonas sp. CAM02]